MHALRARRGPDIDAHFIHLLVIRLLPSLVSLSSPHAKLYNVYRMFSANDSHNHLIGLVRLFKSPRVTEFYAQ